MQWYCSVPPCRYRLRHSLKTWLGTLLDFDNYSLNRQTAETPRVIPDYHLQLP